MFGQFLERLRRARAARKGAAALRGIIETAAATDEMNAAARAAGEPYALLTPIVPIESGDREAWFGGAPHLPDDVRWPEIDGAPLRFVCQIDLSRLPAEIWSGRGPRRGWLAVFLHPQTRAPKALHVDGALRRREGPPQTSAAWSIPGLYDDEDCLRNNLPEWPIAISAHVGEQPDPIGWRKGKAPGFPDPRDAEKPDLADPAFQPFDAVTLHALIDALAGYFEGSARTLDVFLTKKKLRDEDRDALAALQADNRRAVDRFSAIRNELATFAGPFDHRRIGPLLSEIAALPAYELQYPDNDEHGYAILRIARLRLCDRPHPSAQGGVWWYDTYANALYRAAVLAYTRDPQSLPTDLRERMEKIWRFEALHEQGAMGHAPLGHLYTPHGPATKTVVLLELPTSTLLGWIWGGAYSIVLFIDRKALARGDFRRLAFEITN